MKKTLLSLCALAMVVNIQAQVSAPTLTLDWSYTSENGLPSNPQDARWAAGYNGTLYLQDKANARVICLDGKNVTYIETGVDGFAITVDESGNLIINTSPGGSSASSTYKILPAGSTSSEDLVSLTLESFDGYTAGRMDIMGRAIGNVMGDGGVFYTFANGSTKLSKIFVANGKQKVDECVSIDPGKTITASTLAYASPTNSDLNATDNVVWSDRTSAKQLWKLDGTCYSELSGTNATAGGDIVTLSGVLFSIEPNGTNYSDGFIIVDRSTDEIVFTHTETEAIPANKYVTCAYMIFEKINDTTANIYHFTPSIVAAKYTFQVPENYTSIKETLVDENAPVEYYNLQGVKVENPSNGIFIRKQGAKTTKVVL